jgi:hypothetical protein
MLRCTYPAQLLHVTLNHLEALKRIVADSSVGELVDSAIRQSVELYTRLPLGEQFGLQLTLARFFQDRRVKVSLFLQVGLFSMHVCRAHAREHKMLHPPFLPVKNINAKGRHPKHGRDNGIERGWASAAPHR